HAEDRHLRPARAGLRHGGAPDVPLLRRQCRGRLPAVAVAGVAGGLLATVAGARRAGAGAPAPVAVAGGPAAVGPDRLLAVAELAARQGAGTAAGPVHRLRLAAGRAGAVFGA